MDFLALGMNIMPLDATPQPIELLVFRFDGNI
jgi:hypothetical protein